MSFDALFQPLEELDAWLAGLIDGAPLLVALGVAFVLGLRHASDPDHLVAATSLVVAEQGGVRAATRLGAWWGRRCPGALAAAGVRDRPAARPGRHRRGRRPAHRGDAEPLYRTVLVPALGVLGLAFGLWYAGFT
jgi:hypothetical protein